MLEELEEIDNNVVNRESGSSLYNNTDCGFNNDEKLIIDDEGRVKAKEDTPNKPDTLVKHKTQGNSKSNESKFISEQFAKLKSSIDPNVHELMIQNDL